MLSLAQANKAQAGMPGVIEGLNSLLQWADGIAQLASQQPERKPDREREKLKQREQEFDQKQFTAFKQDVGRDVKSHLEQGILREVGKLLRARGVNLQQLRIRDKERFESMVAEADRRLTAALNGDRGFQQQKDRLVATRDKARVLRFYQQKIDYLLADARGPRVAKKVADVFFRGVKPAARPNQNGGQGNGQQRREQSAGGGNGGGGNRIERVSAAPQPGEIDYRKTNDDMILEGQAWLKNGKHVAWR
jgi:hypothetical protein